MNYYAQNFEDREVLNYFKGFKGTMLELGANDGKTLSNSLALIEQGWTAYLVEASKEAYSRLMALHKGNKNVKAFNCAVALEDGKFEFYESGTHLGGKDISLVSTLDVNELGRWGASQKFTKTEVQAWSWESLCKIMKRKQFDYISIDVEGLDLAVLYQMDLTNVKALCIEHNGKNEHLYVNYCSRFGMRVLVRNNENFIFVK